MNVDRIQIAGDGAVAAAEVPGQPPGGRGGQTGALGRSSARRARALLARAAPQVDRLLLPDQLITDTGLAAQGELRAPGMGRLISRPYPQGEGLGGSDRPMLREPVGDVDQADGRVGKIAAGHQGELEREGQHVGIGGRQRVREGESAHAVIRGQPFAIRLDVGQGERSIRSAAAPPPTNGKREAPGSMATPARANSGSRPGLWSSTVSAISLTPRSGSGRRP
jgi:hypothetical protein